MMTTPITLSTCGRCGAYVFACQVDGLKTMADPAPLDQAGYLAALVAGLRVFDLIEAAGRPQKLRTRSGASQPPIGHGQGSTEPLAYSYGTLSGHILAEHGCGASALDAAKAEVVPVGPPRAPATPGASRGGHRRQTAPASAQASMPLPQGSGAAAPSSTTPPSPSAAGHASDHLLIMGRTESQNGTPPREGVTGDEGIRAQDPGQPTCATCGRVIRVNEIHWAIQHGHNYIHAQHERCPDGMAQESKEVQSGR